MSLLINTIGYINKLQLFKYLVLVTKGSSRKNSVYFYHFRKTAGSTVKLYFFHVLRECASSPSNLPQTEGIVLNKGILTGSTISAVSIRNPIERVLSLYWYDHVEYWYDIKKKPSNCFTLNAWIQAWRDQSFWKTNFMQLNNGSNYMEIENYYVKTLIGWNGETPIGEPEFEEACAVLQQFDVVLLTEWLNSATQLSMLDTLFPNVKLELLFKKQRESKLNRGKQEYARLNSN